MIERVEFTKEMKETHTILAPNMLPIHFSLIQNVFRASGYQVEILQNTGRRVVDAGLKYVHNDTCYPALLVIGQFLDALDSGKYDVHKVALLITQTGGGCRASNYIHLLRKALVKAGYGYIPVISLNVSGMEKNSGFQLNLPILRRILAAMAYGDTMMLLKNQIKPYEVKAGETDAMVARWVRKLTAQFRCRRGFNYHDMERNLGRIAKEFGKISKEERTKTKVGIVGEIYVKYSSVGNNGLEDFLFSQDCEIMVPGVMGFLLYTTNAGLEDAKLYGGNPVKTEITRRMLGYLQKIENAMLSAVSTVRGIVVPGNFDHLKSLVQGVIGMGSKMGEGWLLTAEMIELCQQGYDNIVCAQPFGCLPNHVVGKGMVRKIREIWSSANIVAIDYDPGATKVNQENRMKLMLAVAKEKRVAVHN